MSNLFITADTHFGHENIIHLDNRPFKNLEHMDAELIRRWNARVKPFDQIIIAGDFMFHNTEHGKKGQGTIKTPYDYIKQLNGLKYFIRGNHDKSNFNVIRVKGLELSISNKDIWVTHRPQDMRLEYDINFVGHSHSAFKFRKIDTGEKIVYMVNVGVDQWDFYPQKVTDILGFIEREKRK